MDLVGSCTLYAGTAAQQTVRYYAGYVVPGHGAGAPSAQSNCDSLQGDWTPPNGAAALCTPSDTGGGGVDGSTTTFSCSGMNGTDLHCYEYKNVSPSLLATLMSSCTGTQGTGCTTASLVGCCTSPMMTSGATLETCYYLPINQAQAAQGCASQMGMWATLP
jgi:hypothetical protein